MSAPVAQAPVLVFLAPATSARPILSNRISPICFGLPRLNGSTGEGVRFVFKRRHALGEVAGELREAVAVYQDAVLFHFGDNWDEWAVLRFIDGRDAFAAKGAA